MEVQPRLIVDGIPAPAWFARSDGRTEFLNQRWLDYTGLSAERAVQEGWMAAAHPDDRKILGEEWRSLLTSSQPGEMEGRLRRFDGEYRQFLFRISPLSDDPGKAVGWLGVGIEDRARDEKKRTEESARANLRSLRLIVDSIPGLIHTTKPSGEIEFANQPVLDFFGKGVEELEDWTSLVNSDDRSRVLALWNRSLETGELFDAEMRLLRADGAYRWFHSRGLPLRDPWGNITRWYNLLIDIDDRKRAEESLRAGEHKLRLRLNSIAGLITVHAPSGELELANQPFLDYTGETIEELKDFRHVVHPDDVENALSRWADALVTGNPLSVEARLRRRDGVYRWFNASVLPTRNSEGQIGRWYSLLTDIEDRKSAEAALRAKERELSLILESIPGLVWSASPSGDVIYVNQRISEYLGTSDDKLNQSEWTNFLHAEDAESVLRAWAYSVATGERFEVQCRVRRADGVYRWFHSLSQLGHDNDGRPTRWYGLVVDIDDRESMEESLRRTQDQLSRAAHTAAIGELSAAIAHEINQPLTGVVINGHACLRWLSAQPPNLAEAQWAAERVVRDGRNAGDVVRRVRALFRQSASEKIALDVNEVIGEVLRLLWGEMERRHVVVETQYADGVPYVLGDRVQLQQLILNLLLNGIEAMDSVVDRPKRLLISSKQQNPETVLVEISDCGVGLKDPEKVFESFYTTKPNGMGIGLAICRSIVEGHNGRLWAAAGEDCGATFCFTLPAASKAEP